MTTMKRKHLSSIANDVIYRCSETMDTSVDSLVEEFEVGWKFETGNYSRKLVEFCSAKALAKICCNIEERLSDGSFSRFTFDMMLAWEKPGFEDENSYTEGMAKEKEDRKTPLKAEGQEQDDVSLFYSDLMPLLVNNEPSVGEDAFVWLASLVPLTADIVNGRFTFESLTADIANRLHSPAYDIYLKEIDKCFKYLQKQPTPNGVVFADDEFILHVEGTAKTQRVVRHIGGTSWPGRLTLTNYALYFEASGVITYEDALKMDLSKETDHNVKRASTGPWGAPLFDKALIYESSQLSEPVVLEFPEMTSSTRREHWLSLLREVILLHQFLSNLKDISPLQAWEMQARTILAIVRLHAARLMKRISPPVPTSFLIFSLFEDLPKGDYVMEELANTLRRTSSTHPCSATSVLKSLKISQPSTSSIEVLEEMESPTAQPENLSSLETTVNQAREEAKEVNVAMATVEGIKEEGISDSLNVLLELLSPLQKVVPWFQKILAWERPPVTLLFLSVTLIIIYKEWIGVVIAGLLVWGVRKIDQARRQRIKDRWSEIVVYTGSDQSAAESIVTAHHGLQTAHSTVQTANVSLLRIYSILLSKAPKHTDMVVRGLIGLAVFVAVVPLKFIIMTLTLYVFIMNGLQHRREKESKDGRSEDSRIERRLREWWNSIPAIPVRIVDKAA